MKGMEAAGEANRRECRRGGGQGNQKTGHRREGESWLQALFAQTPMPLHRSKPQR